jgi:hypothetical protein
MLQIKRDLAHLKHTCQNFFVTNAPRNTLYSVIDAVKSCGYTVSESYLREQTLRLVHYRLSAQGASDSGQTQRIPT